MELTTRPLRPEDADACDDIMRSLAEFFGHEGGLAEYREAVRTQEGWVAEDRGEVVGFAIWALRTDATAEITWAAVHQERRHGGFGTAVVEALCEDLAGRGYRLALAMTSARDKGTYEQEDVYEPTRQFWFARGFHPLIELDIWDTNYALLMVRTL